MKKKWYIWLSFFAFIPLQSKSAYEVRQVNFDLWLRLCGHVLFVMLTAFFLPMTIIHIVEAILNDYFFSIDEYSFVWVELAVMYFGGVWATYRHMKWRKKYLGK